MKTTILTLLFSLMSSIGFCQAQQVQFLLQPDRTFRTADGANSVEIDCKDFPTGALSQTVLMAARYHSGQPCSYIEDKSINIHEYKLYIQGAGHTFTYFFNFCIMPSPIQHKITILAPKWDHTVYDQRPYYWAKSDFFDSKDQRKSESFLLEELVNKFLNDIIKTILENPTR